MDAQAIVQQEIKTSQGSIDAQPVDPPPNRPGRFFRTGLAFGNGGATRQITAR